VVDLPRRLAGVRRAAARPTLRALQAGFAASALSAEARRGQELVSQVTIKHMSYAHFAIAPNARPDASASASSAMFLVIKLPTRTAYRPTPNKFLENPAAHPPSPDSG